MGRASRAPASLLAAVVLALVSVGTPGSAAVLAAAPSPSPTAAAGPALAASVESGPPGLSVAVSGSGYEADTAYALCLLAADQTQCGSGALEVGSFTADSSGAIPPGSQFRVPGVVAGSYLLVTVGGTGGAGAFAATAPFDVTAPTLSVDPQAGPAGITVAVTGSGYAPSTAYSLCLVPNGTPTCGKAGIALGDVTTDGSGALPTGTTVRIPGQAQATYAVGALVKGAAVPTLIVTAPFVEISPTIALNPPSGPGGTTVTITGAGLAPGAAYTFCLISQAATACGAASADLGGFTADATGAVPDGATLTIPAGDAGDVSLGIRLDGSTPVLLGSVTFSRTAGTAPPSSPPGDSTSAQDASTPGIDGSGSPAPAGVPAALDLGPGGPTTWVLVALAVVAVLAVGLILTRRRDRRSRFASRFPDR